MKLIICESPGKIKKLEKYAGRGWKAIATCGHVRQLANSGDRNLGFVFEDDKINCDFVPRSSRSKQTIARLKKAVQKASRVIIATDFDREGECIGWHVAHALGLKTYERVSFTEITESAVQKALSNPRKLDMELVGAALARSLLDKLVGYTLSPLLWKMPNDAKSAGRVQSAALHLICDRDGEIKNFQPRTYWTVEARYRNGLEAALSGENRFFKRKDVWEKVKAARGVEHKIKSVSKTVQQRQPPAPFTTSTLQQAAGKQLGFSTKKTMSLAQKLYEDGYITYMRSDATFVSAEFQDATRAWLKQNNPDCIPTGEVKQRRTQHRNTQEGHEAVRPTTIERVPKGNTDIERLYDLIWRRAVASQCCAATIENTKIAIVAGDVTFEATGKQVCDRGYSQYWNDLGGERSLPEVKEGQVLDPSGIDLTERQTKPPSPYSEPELVNLLERRGIGRPSTFSSTIETLLSRQYVRRQKKKLVPTDLGRQVDRFLSETVPDVIDADFTSELEENLDKIAEGQIEWQQFLLQWNREFFQPAIDKARQILTDRFGEDEICLDLRCQKCGRQGMDKVYSTSSKIEGDHYLRCPECNMAHFLNQQGEYELPYQERERMALEKEADFSKLDL